MIIDAHTHIFSPHIVSHREEYISRDPCFAMLYGNSKAKLVTVQELLASMDCCEIDMSVIAGIGWVSHELCVESNDYLLECLARYPQRLVGLATVQPQVGDAAIKELERCVQGGVKGLGEMRADVQGFDLTSGTLAEIAAYLVAHDLIWQSHASEPVGHIYSGKGVLTPDVLYPFVLRYPMLKIVLAHWGGGLPFYAIMPEVRVALKNVYFDTAVSSYLYSPSVYSQVINAVGTKNVIFGSDYPLMSPTKALVEVRSSGLTEPEQVAVMGENTMRLFGLGSWAK